MIITKELPFFLGDPKFPPLPDRKGMAFQQLRQFIERLKSLNKLIKGLHKNIINKLLTRCALTIYKKKVVFNNLFYKII